MRIVRYALDVLIFLAGLFLLFVLYRGGQDQIQVLGSFYELSEYWQVAILLFCLIIARTLLAWTPQHVPLLIFCGLMIVFLANGKAIGATDTIPTRFLPLSILREGNFDLNEFPRLYEDGLPSYMFKIDDRYISAIPLAQLCWLCRFTSRPRSEIAGRVTDSSIISKNFRPPSLSRNIIRTAGPLRSYWVHRMLWNSNTRQARITTQLNFLFLHPIQGKQSGFLRMGSRA